MALQPITRKTVEEKGEQIANEQKMLDGLKFARTKGYYGGVDVSQSGEWRLWIQFPGDPSPQMAQINDVFVVQGTAPNDNIIKLVPLSQYTTIYNLPA